MQVYILQKTVGNTVTEICFTATDKEVRIETEYHDYETGDRLYNDTPMTMTNVDAREYYKTRLEYGYEAVAYHESADDDA